MPMYIHIYIYIYTYAYTYMQMYMYMYMRAGLSGQGRARWDEKKNATVDHYEPILFFSDAGGSEERAQTNNLQTSAEF